MNICILTYEGVSNRLMGFITDPIQDNSYVEYKDLDKTYSEIYDNFFAEFGNHSKFYISNCPFEFKGNRVVNDKVSSETIEIDYLLLNEESQQIVDEFFILLTYGYNGH